MPEYFIASAPFQPEQRIQAATPERAAEKAGKYVARGMEGTAQSAYCVWIVEIASEPECWDVTATATVNHSVVVSPHVESALPE